SWRAVRIAVAYDKTDGPPGAPPVRAHAYQGAGFLVLRGLIRPAGFVVTCAHVVRDARARFGAAAPLRVLLGAGNTRPLTLIEEDDAHDLALFQVGGAIPGAKDALADEPPDVLPGAPVYALGYAEENPAMLMVERGVAAQRGWWSAALGGVV